jgi:hypothetical protein
MHNKHLVEVESKKEKNKAKIQIGGKQIAHTLL